MKKINRQIGIRLVLLVALLAMPFVSGQSMPLAVHGTVYSLDGETQVPKGTFISINDTDSKYYVEGATGTFYNSGRYSAAVYGEIGDTVVITTSNGYDADSQSVTLSGSMYNIDLYINTTLPQGPNHPPNITSIPITKAYVGDLYRYPIIATDPDNDTLSYRLIQRPAGMIINSGTGLIEWIPQITQWGRTYPVSTEVSDGRNGTSTQNFTIKVSLLIKPAPPPWQIGYNESEGSIFSINSSDYFAIEKRNTSLEQLKILNYKFTGPIYFFHTEKDSKPRAVRSAGDEVYRYIEIFPLNVLSKNINNVSIKFSVDKSWLNESKINPKDIVVKSLENGRWHIYESLLIKEDDDSFYYESQVKSLGYLAIVAERLEIFKLSGKTEIPYFVVGTVYEKDGKTQSSANIPIRIVNEKTGDETNLETGIGPMNGSYAVVIPGEKGDRMSITVNNNEDSKISFVLREKGNYVDFKKNRLGENFRAQTRNIKKLNNGDLFEFLRQLLNI
jgi:PGF-pre-PGF domain-containing protein